MRRFFYLIVAVCGILFSGKAIAQDIHFSQYLQTPMLVNPGSTGMFEGSHRFISNYKSQWGAMGSPYKTMAFSYDTHLFKDKLQKGNYLGLGLYAFQDAAGDSKLGQTQINVSASGVVQLDHANSLSLGIQGGYAKRSISTDNLRWGNQYDGSGYNASYTSMESFANTSFGYFDLSTGMVWQYRVDEKTFRDGNVFSKFDFGVAYNHLNQPRQRFMGDSERLHSKLVIHGSTEFDLRDSKYAFVASCYFIHQGTQHELVVGGAVKYYLSRMRAKYTGFGSQSFISVGAQFRARDSFVPTLMYEIQSFSIGLSYDYNISTLSQISKNGGLEFVLKYTLGSN